MLSCFHGAKKKLPNSPKNIINQSLFQKSFVLHLKKFSSTNFEQVSWKRAKLFCSIANICLHCSSCCTLVSCENEHKVHNVVMQGKNRRWVAEESNDKKSANSRKKQQNWPLLGKKNKTKAAKLKSRCHLSHLPPLFFLRLWSWCLLNFQWPLSLPINAIFTAPEMVRYYEECLWSFFHEKCRIDASCACSGKNKIFLYAGFPDPCFSLHTMGFSFGLSVPENVDKNPKHPTDDDGHPTQLGFGSRLVLRISEPKI